MFVKLLRAGAMAVLTVLLTGVAAIAARPASATTWYVSTTGSDSNSGAQAAPWATIQHANDSAVVQPGDTVLVEPGTYGGSNTFALVQLSRSGVPGAYITYESQIPGAAKIVVPDAGYRAIYVTPGTTWVKIVGFYITGGTGEGIAMQSAHHIVVADNIVHKTGGSGISTVTGDYWTIENNVVTDCAQINPYAESGISLFEDETAPGDTDTGFHNFVIDNICHNNFIRSKKVAHTDGNGIIIDSNAVTDPTFHHTPYTAKTLVEGNLCYLNGGGGVHAYQSDFVTARNNTCFKNHTDLLNTGTWRGELSCVNCHNCVWVDNIGCTDSSINPNNTGIVYADTDSSAAQDVTWSNNLTYDTNNPASLSVYTTPNFSSGVPAPPNLLGAKPGFQDVAHYNFQIKPGSRPIDAGTSADGVATIDLNGRPRVAGAAVDIGCYELQSAKPNVLVNPGFEGNLFGWSADNADAAFAQLNSAHSGISSAQEINDALVSVYLVTLSQSVANIPNGKYALSAWVESSGGQWDAKMTASGYDAAHSIQTREIDYTGNNPSIPTWTQITLNSIKVTNGKCTVDFFSNSPPSDWLAIDDVSLIHQ